MSRFFSVWGYVGLNGTGQFYHGTVLENEAKRLARECGFELAGVAAATPSADIPRYQDWVQRGMAGSMEYLTDRRAELRRDPKHLLASARSIICVGKLYNGVAPCSTRFSSEELGWIS